MSAAECLAHSVNAGLVQIGTRVEARALRGFLEALGYGRRPESGLGGERPGHLPPLPWDLKYRHASVCIGYETQVTLWQHAAALACVVRGGLGRPLVLLDGVEQAGERRTLERPQERRVFSTAACAEVRRMMALAAREGTGRRVAGPEVLADLEVGTKTGTGQKVPTEVCIHAELADQVRHGREGSRCSARCRSALVARGPVCGRRACVTLSMAAFGRIPGTGREVLVLAVVDEPRRGGRYGSEVAGPLAIAILEEALGRTVLGQPRTLAWAGGFGRGATEDPSQSLQPWAEVPR